MSNFKGRAIRQVEAKAMPTKPNRDECLDLTDDEFAELYKQYEEELLEWGEAQKGVQIPQNNEDIEHGPGVERYINPNDVTGPGVDIESKK